MTKAQRATMARALEAVAAELGARLVTTSADHRRELVAADLEAHRDPCHGRAAEAARLRARILAACAGDGRPWTAEALARTTGGELGRVRGMAAALARAGILREQRGPRGRSYTGR
jgi:hypothetical protein